MKIKRFQAADVRQAIKEVREVLGPDAVILSNTRVDGGVEIVAATDYDEKEFKRPAQTKVNTEQNRVEINPSIRAEQPIAPPQQNIWSQEPTLVQMRKEISGLKDMLENQLSELAWKDMKHSNTPVQSQLLQRHLQLGIQIDLAKKLVSQVHSGDDLETAWRHSLGALAQQIDIHEDDIIT